MPILEKWLIYAIKMARTGAKLWLQSGAKEQTMAVQSPAVTLTSRQISELVRTMSFEDQVEFLAQVSKAWSEVAKTYQNETDSAAMQGAASAALAAATIFGWKGE